MNIIDQLEQVVTSAVLGNYVTDDKSQTHHTADYIDSSNMSRVSLLEQFYAILAARLALPQVYSQLMRDDALIVNDNVAETPLFEQLWQAPDSRQTIIQELAATHHLDEMTTTALILNAAPLAYRELKVMANGQFLPAFLQGEQHSFRHHLPIWAAPLISVTQTPADELFEYQNAIDSLSDVAATPVSLDKHHTAPIVPNSSAPLAADPSVNSPDETVITDYLDTSALHANPAAHHLAENSSLKRERIRSRNQSNDLFIRVFLLLAAIAAIGLIWALLIRPNSPPVEPIATAPVAVPTAAPPAQVLTPVELIVGVDNSGSLYACSASVGDAALQSTLQQALNSSFGEQASMCQLTVQEGVAKTITNMPIESLPNLLTLLRATPFARLQLQNERITVEAPDGMQLQQLATNIRTLVPAMMVDSAAPIPLPSNSGMATNNMAAMNDPNNQFSANGSDANNPYAANNGNNEYQAADDDTGDSVMPAPIRNNEVNNAPSNNFPTNNPTRSNNERPATAAPSGPISQSEADDMANSIIMADPVLGRK